jgi:signal transduction histidine kinase/ligand-binding sensor domain-containing protein
MNRKIITFLLFVLPVALSGQSFTGQGFPFIRNFTPSEYNAHSQNFAIVTGNSGLTYFGNFAGILQYDGEQWRLIPTENTSRVSALAKGDDGRIYAGATGEIGYLGADERGATAFVSLLAGREGSYPAFGEVGNIFTAGETTTFITRSHIIILKNGELAFHSVNGEVTGSWQVNGKIFFQERESGLMIFEDSRIMPAEGGSFFTEALDIRAMLSVSDDSIMVATGSQGLFLLENGRVTASQAPVSDFLKKNLVTCGISLSDGTFALGTLRQGIVVTDKNGKALQWIDRKANLRNQFVQALYSPGNNILWTALNNGISLIEIPSRFTFFDDKSGLEGEVNQTIRFNNTLYVATYQGLFYFDANDYVFRPFREIISSCRALLPVGNQLLAATSQGIFEVQGQKATLVKEGFAMSLAASLTDPDLVFAGEMRGLFRLRKEGGTWKSWQVDGENEEIVQLQADNSGNLWGAALSRGIFMLAPDSREPRYFSEAEGLTGQAGLNIYPLRERMAVPTRNGVFLYNPETDRFEPASLLNLPDSSGVEWYSFIVGNSDGSLWVNDGDETYIRLLYPQGGTYTEVTEPFLPFSASVVRNVFNDTDGISWLGGPDGLIRYNPAVVNNNILPGSTLIRKITTGSDSVIWYGNTDGAGQESQLSSLRLPYKNNSLRFDFSLPYFHPKGGTEYQVLLEGFDEGWSDWSVQPYKEYTNLPFGRYHFYVKARNIYDHTAQTAGLEFQILTPWYATVWAIILYLVLLGALLYLMVILRHRKLISEKRMLEQTIQERTAEVVQQKEEIESQSQELTHKNDELEKINSAIKSINAEINLENLLQSLLEKMKIIRAVENSLVLVHDKNSDQYRYTASVGWNLPLLQPLILTLEEAENLYIRNAEEVYEDIFVKREFSTFSETAIREFQTIKSMIILVIKIEHKVEAFLILDNRTRENAFGARDISFLKNSKEHIISAFIRTRILEDLQNTLQNLKETQDQLIQSEKLASLGELTAGIAHEIQNPLNFVNNFSSLSMGLADELHEFLENIKDKIDEDRYADADEVIGMIRGNVKKINEHGKRAESIVKGMLQHSRGKTGEYELIDINNMVSEYVNLAYHGMRAKDKSFNTAIRTQLDPEVGKASIVPQDLSRVVLNIVNNSCYALDEKTKKGIPGFAPEVVVSTKKIKDRIEIRIRDNGTGIPQHVIDKIFNPFFTTKPTGKGTGLGLSMSYDIVTKMHKGKLEVNSKEGEFTEFIITIPEKQS